MRSLVVALLAGFSMIHPAETSADERDDRIGVRELSPQWRVAGPARTWKVGGEIVTGVHPVPGGDLLAVVRRAASFDVVRWDPRGKELVRRTLELDVSPMTARTFAKELILATRTTVLALDAGTLRTARSRHLPQLGDTDRLEAAPSGVWVLGKSGVSFFGFDGQTATRPWPLSKQPKPPCPASVPCVQAKQEHTAWMAESGDLLVVERQFEEYPIKSNIEARDTVGVSTATRLDTRAAPVAQIQLSQVKTHREWFWRGDLSGNPTGIHTPGGIVRTRYGEEVETGFPLASLGGNFLFDRGPSRNHRELALLDSHFVARWKTRISDLAAPVVSPGWVTPTLIHSSDCYRFASVDERGKVLGEEMVSIEDLPLERFADKKHLPRFAIGQTAPGAGWLLIAY
jgi:hypothetical protein